MKNDGTVLLTEREKPEREKLVLRVWLEKHIQVKTFARIDLKFIKRVESEVRFF